MLKVVFICGCLEPGKDGVGDYCRNLAVALARHNYQPVLMALNDFYIQSPVEETHSTEKSSIITVRYPSGFPLKQRFNLASDWLKNASPQWISLQYVPYAFHPKGIAYAWAGLFKKLEPQSKWHVMMHELWIGGKPEDRLKDKMIGKVQRAIIRNTLQSINPVAITTSLPFYQRNIKRIGFEADITPIFSNLPVGSSTNKKLWSLLPQQVQNDREQIVVAVFFGTIHPVLQLTVGIKKLAEKAKAENKKLVVVHAGRSGNVQAVFLKLEKDIPATYIILGEQEAMDVASFFQQADVGLSTYSKTFLGKSGSIAAMLNNGLPVILLENPTGNENWPMPYAKQITEIDSLKDFVGQDKSFTHLYGIEGTTAYYQQLFND